MNNIEQALKSAIETIENVDKLLATLGIIVDSRWSAESLMLCKSALAEIGKCEPVANRNEAVSHLWESIGLWSAYLASNGEQAELSPPSWLVDAINNATSPQQREWKDIDLSEYENQGLGVIAEEICTKLKQLNSEKG